MLHYFLAIERMPGDTKFIDTSKLSLLTPHDIINLQTLDAFCMSYTYDEIKKSIIDANIISQDYMKGKLVIQDANKHHPLKIITKDYLNGFDLYTFFNKYINNKEIMNNINYKYKTLEKDELLNNALKKGIENKDIDLIVNAILSSEYLTQRKFMLYLIDLYHKIN